jgi:hypothetical protein
MAEWYTRVVSTALIPVDVFVILVPARLCVSDPLVNEVWGVQEYQTDGLSATSARIRVSSARAAWLYNKELIASGRHLPWRLAMRTQANLVRFSLHNSCPTRYGHFANAPSVPLFLAAGFGFAFFI